MLGLVRLTAAPAVRSRAAAATSNAESCLASCIPASSSSSGRTFSSSSLVLESDSSSGQGSENKSTTSAIASARDRLRRFSSPQSRPIRSPLSPSPSSSSSSPSSRSSISRPRFTPRAQQPPSDSQSSSRETSEQSDSYGQRRIGGRSRANFNARNREDAGAAPRDPRQPRGRRTAGPGGAAPGGRRTRGGGRRRGPTSILPFEQWIKGPIAARYKEVPSTRGPHWIGDTPFPLNPSFRPPAPVHAKVKDEIWRLHSSDPAKYTVRTLSGQFSISLPRVEAILRLKALEVEFGQQGIPLQTEFQSNMDRLLGAELRPNLNPERDPVPERKDHSPRGQIYEESSELAPTDQESAESESILGPALASIEAERNAAVQALPQRGVDRSAISPPRTLGSIRGATTTQAEAEAGVKKRAVLTVVNVSGRSYEGDGRIARNRKRAAKRKAVKAKQRAAREVIASKNVAEEQQVAS
ncbi:hypothetical protein OC861_004938 [Tilletia horrida]|nr:hypothetical protein OC861_004938 [Tilletia horrida]